MFIWFNNIEHTFTEKIRKFYDFSYFDRKINPKITEICCTINNA